MLAFYLGVLLTTPLAAEAFLEVVNKVADGDWDCTTGVADEHRTNMGNGVSEAKCRKMAREGTKGAYVWYHGTEHCYVYESHSLDSDWKETQMEKDKNGNLDSNWKTCKWAAKVRTIRYVNTISTYQMCCEITMTNCDNVIDEFKKQMPFEDGTCADGMKNTIACGEANQSGMLPCERSVEGVVGDTHKVQCTETVVQPWKMYMYVDDLVLKNLCPRLKEVAVGSPRDYQAVAQAMQYAFAETFPNLISLEDESKSEEASPTVVAGMPMIRALAVEETHTTSLAVMGFAAFGLSVVLYGSYKHYFEKN